MSLIERLNEDMKQAMKAKEKLKLSVIRMIKASLQNERIQLGVHELSEDEELTILSREMKQRTDSIKEFQEAGREDLTKKLEDEIKILQDYMQEQLSDEELAEIVKTTISEVNATSKKDFGKVMGQVMHKEKGKTDGSKVQKLVQEYQSKKQKRWIQSSETSSGIFKLSFFIRNKIVKILFYYPILPNGMERIFLGSTIYGVGGKNPLAPFFSIKIENK